MSFPWSHANYFPDKLLLQVTYITLFSCYTNIINFFKLHVNKLYRQKIIYISSYIYLFSNNFIAIVQVFLVHILSFFLFWDVLMQVYKQVMRFYLAPSFVKVLKMPLCHISYHQEVAYHDATSAL